MVILDKFADAAKFKLFPVEGAEKGKLCRKEFWHAFTNSLRAGTLAGIGAAFFAGLMQFTVVIPGVWGFLLTAFLWIVSELLKRLNDSEHDEDHDEHRIHEQ